MPTGYTHDVQTGDITKFGDFAMSCAKAFGACISLRDEPQGSPIPMKLEAETSYHDKELARAKATLVEVSKLNNSECDERAAKEHLEAVSAHTSRQRDRETGKQRYEAMLLKVKGWAPPTEGHTELKEFMAAQLTDSIRFDCSSEYDVLPTYLTGEAWWEKTIDKANKDIEYHSAKKTAELERIYKRNQWLDALRGSLRT